MKGTWVQYEKFEFWDEFKIVLRQFQNKIFRILGFSLFFNIKRNIITVVRKYFFDLSFILCFISKHVVHCDVLHSDWYK